MIEESDLDEMNRSAADWLARAQCSRGKADNVTRAQANKAKQALQTCSAGAGGFDVLQHLAMACRRMAHEIGIVARARERRPGRRVVGSFLLSRFRPSRSDTACAVAGVALLAVAACLAPSLCRVLVPQRRPITRPRRAHLRWSLPANTI